jgi:hypothetical protein
VRLDPSTGEKTFQPVSRKVAQVSVERVGGSHVIYDDTTVGFDDPPHLCRDRFDHVLAQYRAQKREGRHEIEAGISERQSVSPTANDPIAKVAGRLCDAGRE